jgi:hypothetical protein
LTFVPEQSNMCSLWLSWRPKAALCIERLGSVFVSPVTNYQALCRELTVVGTFGELSVAGARSVARRYSDAWFQAAKRRRDGTAAGFPRRKRSLVPVRFHHATFLLQGKRVRLTVARGQPELWVRLARPVPYPAEQIRAITLLAESGRLWLSVTAAVPVEVHELNAELVGGVDLGIVCPYAVVAGDAGLLISGRAIRAENYLHLRDQQGTLRVSLIGCDRQSCI